MADPCGPGVGRLSSIQELYFLRGLVATRWDALTATVERSSYCALVRANCPTALLYCLKLLIGRKLNRIVRTPRKINIEMYTGLAYSCRISLFSATVSPFSLQMC